MTLVILDKSSAHIVCGTSLIAAKNTADPTARQITKWDRKVKRGISTVLHRSHSNATALDSLRFCAHALLCLRRDGNRGRWRKTT
jgi:hypothetical protein